MNQIAAMQKANEAAMAEQMKKMGFDMSDM